jgi:hypothetical protein
VHERLTSGMVAHDAMPRIRLVASRRCCGLQTKKFQFDRKLSDKQWNARAAAILPDKSDACPFQSLLQRVNGGSRDIAARFFKIDNR